VLQIFGPGGGGSSDLTQEAISADADKAMAVNTLYKVTMAAWASDNIFSLPSTAAVDDVIGVDIVDGDATYDLQLRTTAASNDTINAVDHDSLDFARMSRKGEYIYFRCVTADTAWIVEDTNIIGLSDSAYIRGVGFNRNSTTAIQIETGEIAIDGTLHYITSAFTTKTAGSDALAASKTYYVYLTNDAGTLKQHWEQFNTTADDPVYNARLDYWEHPSSGSAYRCIGAFDSNGSSEIHIETVTKVNGREIMCSHGTHTIAVAQTTSGTHSLDGLVPPMAQRWFIDNRAKRTSGTGTATHNIRYGTAATGAILAAHLVYTDTASFVANNIWAVYVGSDLYLTVGASTSSSFYARGFIMRR
jgi:hypothetical protein